MLEADQNVAGTRMTCTDPECECELEIVAPCPHGTRYVCGCGHEMQQVSQGR